MYYAISRIALDGLGFAIMGNPFLVRMYSEGEVSDGGVMFY